MTELQTLGKKILKGTFFVAFSTYLVYFISIVRSIVLARLLLPEYFGIVALATFFYSFISQFKEFGLDYVLIHKQDKQELAYSTHFMLQTMLGMVNIVVVLAVIPILSKFYEPRVIKILLIFAVFSIFQAMSSTPRVFLEKHLAFGKITAINIATVLIRTIIPIVMVAKGFGLWSLVWLAILDMIVPFIGYWIIHPWKLNLNFDKQMVKWFFRFGFYMWLGGIAMVVLFEFDKFLVGSFVGLIALGFYSKAFEFTRLPVQMICHVLNKVTMPAYSKLQTDHSLLSLTFSMTTSIIFRLIIICAVIIVLIAPEFVKLFLGEKWIGMITILQIFAGFTVLRSLYDQAVTLFIAMGKPDIPTKVHFVQAAIMIILGPIGILIMGAKGMAVVINIMLAAGVIIIYYFIAGVVKISYKNIIFAPLFSACLSFFGASFISIYLPESTLAIRLFVKIILCSSIYVVALLIIEGKKIKEKINFIKNLWQERIDLIENPYSRF